MSFQFRMSEEQAAAHQKRIGRTVRLEDRRSCRNVPATAAARDSERVVKPALTQLPKKQPRVKNTKRVDVGGIPFDSTREARRYQDLELMQKAGQISELRRQVKFPIYIGKIFICEYRADFTYKHLDGTECVEDSKGHKTDVYKLKKRMVEAYYNIVIKET